MREASALPASPPPVVRSVTPDQIATAMQQDHFYSDYADSVPTTLRVKGTVVSVRHQPQDLRVELRTGVPTTVWCDLGATAAEFSVGATVTVEAPAKQAERVRQPVGVLLTHCRLAAAP